MQIILLTCESSSDLTGWISVCIAFAALIVTILIPVQVMKFQRYTSLSATYMSMDFGHAIQGVIDFYYDDCECNVERIPEEYEKRFYSDRKKLAENIIDTEDVLHYQRRLLNDYFLEIEMCRQSSWILREIIRKNWTRSEAWICKILIFMNSAVDSNPEIFKDISKVKHEKMPKTKGINKYLESFYQAQKAESRSMQVY